MRTRVKSTSLPRMSKANASRAAKINAKARIRTAKAKYKVAKINAKSMIKEAKHQANLKRGGPAGAFARKLEFSRTKSEARRIMEADKPGLIRAKNKVAMETEASVRKTKARGAAGAAIASALSSGYAAKSQADSAATQAKARADEKASEALMAELNSVPEVYQEKPEKSVSGLVTGVR